MGVDCLESVHAATAQASAAVPPARILIQPAHGTSLSVLAEFHTVQGCRVRSTFPGFGNLQILEVTSGGPVESIVTEYKKSGLVEFAEPDQTGQLFATIPNETAFSNGTLWGLTNINAPQAWDMLTNTGNIVIALVDTGVRYTHEDLASNMWVNPLDGSHGWNAITGTNNPSDSGTHGTMMAGVVGAVGSNGKGVVGVPWHVRVMACAAFNSTGTGNVSDAITCLDYARTNGANIINASWGFATSQALSNAMVNLRSAGILVVAAPGNSGSDIDASPVYPAAYALDNIIKVTSTSKSDVMSTFSSYGATNVDLGAPGEQIYTTFPATDNFYFTDSGGTSYSAAYVSGACALLRAQYPADSPREIIRRILATTDPLPSLAGKCRSGGRLNLGQAMHTILLAALPATNGAPFQLRVSGGLNRTCVIETSTNLTRWSPVITNTCGPNGTFDYPLPTSTGLTETFFRASPNP